MSQTRRPSAVNVLLVVLAFLGITALGGGIEMMLFPGGNQYVRGEWLEGTSAEEWRPCYWEPRLRRAARAETAT